MFELQKGENVLITRIYEKKQLGEILFQGLIGLFDLKDFDIFEKVLSRSKSPRENVEFDENDDDSQRESKKIPKVLQRKQMMEDRNKTTRSKTPVKEIKEEKMRMFNEKTVLRKGQDDERNNWNYGKITFQIKEKR